MANETLKRTPLYEAHLQLNARMVPFAGYEMPVQYTSVLEEAKATRATCGLFDVSHMGQFSIRGKNPLQEVQKLVTNDLSKIQLGQAQYNMLCNEKGGVIDDLIIYRRKEDETYICVNASNRQADFDWMKTHLPSSVALTDESDQTALIAVQGPKAEELILSIGDRLLAKHLKYYWAQDTKVFDKPCYLSRTGYTGEDGFELYVRSDQAQEIWNRLMEAGKRFGLTPCGLGARDTLRLEMGYPLHGHEITPEISPIAAGLSWVVKVGLSTAFIGQDALKQEATIGSKNTLKAFAIDDRRLARQGYKILNKDGLHIGEITSGSFSPHLNGPIAMGFVSSSAKEPFFVEVREAAVPLKVVKLPFVPSHTKKN